MKIRLEPNEIGAILKEWGHAKYKTRNINCDLEISKNTVEAVLEIIMPDQDIGEAQINASMAEIMAAQKGLPRVHYNEPDFMPDFSGATEGL
jgi:hypothetical protein